MNTDLLFGGSANGSSSPAHSSSFPSLSANVDADGDVGGLMSPVKPRPQEDIGSYTTPLRLGLNLGRSQSAAPETWEYGNSIPSSTKSERYKLRDESGFFGRSGIFDEAEEDRETSVQSVRRPASTGVIGRRNESDDVNSILETLGLASLESSDNDVSSSYVGGAMGGIGSYTSPGKPSVMAKIREGGDTPTDSSESNTFLNNGEERQSVNPFTNQGQVGLQNGSNHSFGGNSGLQQQGIQYQYPAASDVSQLCLLSLFVIDFSPMLNHSLSSKDSCIRLPAIEQHCQQCQWRGIAVSQSSESECQCPAVLSR